MVEGIMETVGHRYQIKHNYHTDKLTNIKEQLNIIRTTHQDIFSTLIVENLQFSKRYEKIEENQEIGKLMYDILIPVTDENLENEYIRCPEDDKDITCN
uniref:Uncharacterized protein n=1 Tax=Meloidogyne incognita TaxID=6306 RepID=A0A914KQP4_MELIC